jgi:glycosyltransferase involved in cell wall biosynthesis
MGDYNGVRVTSDPNVITENFDLCIVHGWTGGAQNYVIQNAHLLRCPLYYLIIKTDPRPEVNMALEKATYIGCATAQDGAFAMLRGHENKIQRIKYPINYKRITKTREEIRNEFELTKDRVFISVGGFAPHKGMNELVEAFEEFNDLNTELVLAGYDLNHGVPDVSKCKSKIQLYNLEDQQSVYELMSVADLLIWNSLKGTEGYGLVLLEAMLYGCKWYARDDVAGMDLAMLGYGTSYHTKDQLVELMKN